MNLNLINTITYYLFYLTNKKKNTKEYERCTLTLEINIKRFLYKYIYLNFWRKVKNKVWGDFSVWDPNSQNVSKFLINRERRKCSSEFSY